MSQDTNIVINDNVLTLHDAHDILVRYKTNICPTKHHYL